MGFYNDQRGERTGEGGRGREERGGEVKKMRWEKEKEKGETGGEINRENSSATRMVIDDGDQDHDQVTMIQGLTKDDFNKEGWRPLENGR